MEVSHDYFLCDSCQNKNFTRIHSFSIRFYGVNFSDDLIYDKLTDEMFQCTKCGKTFTKEQIEDVLAEFKKKRRGSTEE
jgi:hypothetical protein